MPSFGPSLLETVVATRRRLGRTTIVGISGIDCAGKTTLAACLAQELRDAGQVPAVIGGDDFNRPRGERSLFPAQEPDYGYAFEQLVEEVLAPARAGDRVEARLRVKDWGRDAWDARTVVVEPGSIVLVEGVFLFMPAIVPLLDLKVWVEIGFDEALDRALERDAQAMGGEDGVRERYATRYWPAQRLHLERERPREAADLVLPGSSAAAIHVTIPAEPCPATRRRR